MGPCETWNIITRILALTKYTYWDQLPAEVREWIKMVNEIAGGENRAKVVE